MDVNKNGRLYSILQDQRTIKSKVESFDYKLDSLTLAIDRLTRAIIKLTEIEKADKIPFRLVVMIIILVFCGETAVKLLEKLL